MKTLNYFKNESDVLQVGGLQVENRLDRVTLSGDVDLTLDVTGLALTELLLAQLTEIKAVMDKHAASGTLPDRISIAEAKPAGNIFGLPNAG